VDEDGVYQYRVQIRVTVPGEYIGPCEKQWRVLESVVVESLTPLLKAQVLARAALVVEEIL